MNYSRSPREAVKTMIRAIQSYLAVGVCQNCALLLAAHAFGMDLDQVEQVWIDYQINQLDKEV